MIRASVGKGGIDARGDVLAAQRLLNARTPGPKLTVDAVAGPRTIAGLTRPVPPAAQVADPDRLSGSRWWHGNQARYPNSGSLHDPAPGFRESAGRFVAALRAGGAGVRVSATLRNPVRANPVRAHLMHDSWRVLRGQVAPEDVPDIRGCDIVWDHGDLTRSRTAAAEMVRLFRIVFKPSLTSNHIRGTAIDMTIEQPAESSLVNGAGAVVPIRSAADLHRVGASYGVHKPATDPPHWSANGR